MARMEQLQSITLRRCRFHESFRPGTVAYVYRHQKFPEYPVVVSEIASISRDKKEVFSFTAQVANWMDACPYVSEYSFFGCMAKCADDFVSPEAQLMNADSTFTPLMDKLMNEQPMTNS